jgi:two-component system, chemotaxis family, sensor kinase Cph1
VALTGESVEFESDAQELGKHYHVTAYCPQKGLFATIFSDITDRKRAEETIKESEKKFRNLFEHSPVGKSMTGIDGSLHVNTAFAETVGYSEQELRERNWKEITHPDDIQYTADIIQSMLDGKTESARFEKRYIHKNGSTIWTDVSTYLQRDTNGDPQFFITTLSNISARKIAELEREHLLTELESKNTELEQIVYITSHDLRSPLVNVQGFSKELESSLKELPELLPTDSIGAEAKKKISLILDKEVPDDLKFIMASVYKMDTLLNGLLRLSRLGRVQMSISKLSMDEIVSMVSKSFEYRIQKSGIVLKIDKLHKCYGDENMVNQVFSNLIDNAIKYSDAERPLVINISSYQEKDMSVYCVEDNGIGIDPLHQNKIFEIFHRLNPTENVGEGLGLTISRRILERLRGKIWVESVPGVGSKFYISLPKA